MGLVLAKYITYGNLRDGSITMWDVFVMNQALSYFDKIEDVKRQKAKWQRGQQLKRT